MVVLVLNSQAAPAQVVRHARAARRLRLSVPGLQWDVRAGGQVERALSTWPGVEEARADVRTGNVLVRYSAGAPLLARLREEPDVRSAPRRGAVRVTPSLSQPWHALSMTEVLQKLSTSTEGLSQAEVGQRLRQHGLNLQEEEHSRSSLALLGRQVANLPMALLLGSAGVSALLGDGLETSAILVVVGVNVAIGYRMEKKNQELIASWRQLEAGQATVLREGVLRTTSAAELVPGDVLLVGPGDRIPADARVLQADRLACDEAPLTGESEPRAKHPEAVADGAPLAERTCLLYGGTTVSGGHGRAVVVATGASTEVANVRALVRRGRAPEDPLVRRLEKMDRSLAGTAALSAVLTGLSGLLHRRPAARVVRSAVALGVATFPEGLPLVATSALVRSMQRLQARGLVVRRMAAAEALGGVTLICVDKTGTLTVNEMALEVLDLGAGPISLSGLKARPHEKLQEDVPSFLLAAAVLNSDVDVHRNGSHENLEMTGSSTERALVSAALEGGLDPERLRTEFPRLALRGRSNGVRYQVTVHRAPGGAQVAFLKGAPRQVLALCNRTARGPLDANERAKVLASNEQMANDGMRVLAVAWRRMNGAGDDKQEEDYTLLGLVGLRDQMRESAADTIRQAREAGIRTLIVTGDQKHTAEAVARQVGIDGLTCTAEELTPMLERADGELERVAVVARVSPEDKLALVRALRARGEVVAMAGDGINDAPALKAADVGIAVGANASDLARQVADVVMAGDDLRSIVAAVGEGRIVQDNLRRAMRYLLATNFSELALMLGAAVSGQPEPLSPLQLLWINLLTDTLPGVALALEPGDPDVLDRPPAPPEARLLSKAAAAQVIRDGSLLAAVSGAALIFGGPPASFSLLSAAQLGYALACRAPRSAGALQVHADRRFGGLVGSSASLHLAMLTLPPLRRLLALPPPGLSTLGATAVGAAVVLKLFGRRDLGTTVVRRSPFIRFSPEVSR